MAQQYVTPSGEKGYTLEEIKCIFEYIRELYPRGQEFITGPILVDYDGIHLDIKLQNGEGHQILVFCGKGYRKDLRQIEVYRPGKWENHLTDYLGRKLHEQRGEPYISPLTQRDFFEMDLI